MVPSLCLPGSSCRSNAHSHRKCHHSQVGVEQMVLEFLGPLRSTRHSRGGGSYLSKFWQNNKREPEDRQWGFRHREHPLVCKHGLGEGNCRVFIYRASDVGCQVKSRGRSGRDCLWSPLSLSWSRGHAQIFLLSVTTINASVLVVNNQEKQR